MHACTFQLPSLLLGLCMTYTGILYSELLMLPQHGEMYHFCFMSTLSTAGMLTTPASLQENVSRLCCHCLWPETQAEVHHEDGDGPCRQAQVQIPQLPVDSSGQC